MIKAIETQYKGYRFRSRLEARWAVFFDALGVKWEYEKEGYELPSGRYLPDFWLSTVNMWGEVKPRPLSEEEREKALELARESGYPVLQLVGTPTFTPYMAFQRCWWCEDGVSEDRDTCPSCEGTGWWEIDYILDSNYLDEHRFYVQSCEEPGADLDQLGWGRSTNAYEVARSARFEFGESPR